MGHKEMLLITLVETDIFENFLNKSDAPLCHMN